VRTFAIAHFSPLPFVKTLCIIGPSFASCQNSGIMFHKPGKFPLPPAQPGALPRAGFLILILEQIEHQIKEFENSRIG
jgi:hypothetical protein